MENLELKKQLSLLRAGLVVMAVVSLVLAWLAARGAIEVWHIAVGALLNGVFWVIDNFFSPFVNNTFAGA